MRKQRILLALTFFAAMTTMALIFRSNFSVPQNGSARSRALEVWTSLRHLTHGREEASAVPSQSVVRTIAAASAEGNATVKNGTSRVTTGNQTKQENKAELSVGGPRGISISDSSPNRPMTCKNCFWPNFTVLLENPKLCDESGGQTPVLIMMITSTAAATDRRQAIRDTWASITRGNTGQVRHVFLLGTTSDREAMQTLTEESTRFGDIVLADFVDAYSNLTLKTMVGLKWIINRCGQARFFLKTDQDMFVFVERLLTLLLKEETTLKTSLGGACYQSGKPWRDPKTKYYASIRSYPQSTYPGFCSGTGYVGHMDLARKVVAASPGIPFFHLEDVYVTLVLRHIGYRLKRYEGFATGPGVCKNPTRAKNTYTIHEVTPENIRKFWTEKCGQ